MLAAAANALLAQSSTYSASVDKVLKEKLSKDKDTDVTPVIVSAKPGKKSGLINAVQAQGGTIRADFTIIEAFASDMPLGLVRALQRNGDVVALSSNAEVTANGLSTTVSGAPLNAPYTLRSTLGLDEAIVTGGTSSKMASTAAATLTWSHTVAQGANRLLLVRTAQSAKSRVPDVTAVTYGGAALTKATAASTGANAAAMWYLVAPAVGTANVTVTLSGFAKALASATSFTGVDQVAPVARVATATGTTLQAVVSARSNIGELVVDAIATSGDATSLTPPDSRLVQFNGGTGVRLQLGHARRRDVPCRGSATSSR